MPAEDKMTIDERRPYRIPWEKYLRKMKKRYARTDRKARGQLLDEMEAVTRLHRKSLIRLMNGSLERKQRGRSYGSEVDDALRVIAESLDYLCAERLTPNLVWMTTHLATHGELEVSSPLLEKLGRISVSTVQRILARIGQDQPRLPCKGPERAHRVTRDIPMKRIPWDEQQPGHFEADLVHHCGPSASGGVCPYHPNDRCGYRLERASSRARAQLPGDGRCLSPHFGSPPIPCAGNPL